MGILLIQEYSSPHTPRVHTAGCDDRFICLPKAISAGHIVTVLDNTIRYNAAERVSEAPSDTFIITVSISDENTTL